MAFKMKGFSAFKIEEDKKFKPRSADIMAKEGEYKGQMVDPRTGMPKGVSKQEPKRANQKQIDNIRKQMRGLNPFIDKEKYDALNAQLKSLMKSE